MYLVKGAERKFKALVEAGFVVLEGKQVSYLEQIVQLCKQNNVKIEEPWTGNGKVKIVLS
jgi:hypothetical protein